MDLKSDNTPKVFEIPIDPKCVPDVFLSELYFKTLKEHGEEIAQIDVETGKSETHKEVLFKSICVAQEILARGVQQDDIISICSYNIMETVLPFLAAHFLLNKLSCLDPTLPLDDFKYFISITKPRMIFAVPESEEAIESVIKDLNLNTELVIFGETTRNIPFKEFLVVRGTESTFQPRKGQDLFETAAIYFSSGSTGLPKGSCLTHYGLSYSFHVFREYFDAKITLHYSTPYWISYAIMYSITLLQGGCRLIVKQFDEDKILQYIEKYQVTTLFLPPSFTYAVTKNPNINKHDLSSVRSILAGGSSLAEDQIQMMRSNFKNAFILHAYGMTEINGMCTMFNPHTENKFICSKPSSCGKLISGMSAKVVDPETNKILGPYQHGELMIKSKGLMNCYYQKPLETKEVFDEDGFLHTGDILYFDDEDCFYCVNRIKEMFKYRMWHIIPSELEQILLTHPAVKEAVVIGYPHEEDGDHAMAVVVLEDGATITEEELVTFFNEKVPDRKKLRAGVQFVEEIPRTITGKYNRLALRNKIIKS